MIECWENDVRTLAMKLPQLSLRELFLLVALAAMGCGRAVDHNQRIGVRRAGEVIQGDTPQSNDLATPLGPGMMSAKKN
jgi:hypothetical protein